MTCTLCPLHLDCRTVNIQPDGVGDVVFLGEAPGADEDLRGVPFIGQSGKLLRDFVGSLNIPPERVRYTNSVRCRPVANKTPVLKNVKACLTHLIDEFMDNPPKIIVPLGNTALNALRLAGLLKAHGKITALHGKVIQEDDYFVLPMLHPAFLLRDPNMMPLYVQSMNRLEDLFVNGPAPKMPTDYKFSWRVPELKAAIKEAKRHPKIAYDIETSTLKPMYPRARILCFSLTWKAGQAFGFELTPENYDEALNVLHTEFLEDDSVQKIIQHAKFELMWSMSLGRTILNMTDTMLKKWHVNEANRTHSLDKLAAEYTDMGFYDQAIEDYKAAHPEANPDKTYVDETTGEELQGSYANIPMEILLPYNCMDTDAAFRVEEALLPRLNEKQKWIHDYIQIPQCYPLAEMELKGVRMNWKYLEKLDDELPKKSKAYNAEIMKFPEVRQLSKEKMERKGEEINLKSPIDLPELLFNRLRLPIVTRTDKGAPSTDKYVLEYLAARHPLPALLLKKRKIDTFHSTFVQGLLKARVGDGVHTSYGMVHTVTGRPNSTDPNLNNIPRDDEDAEKKTDEISIKEAFLPDEGCWIVQADYSQVELRIMALFSGDETLLGYFRAGLDVHRMIAARINKCEPEKVTKAQRTAAKRTVFGLCYGQTPQGLAEELGCHITEAEGHHQGFFREFPKVKKWMLLIEKQAVETGQVESMWGRIRRLPEAQNPDPRNFKRLEAIRQAVNAPIQSTAGDVLHKKMGELWHWMRSEMPEMKSRFILTVYDSLVSSVPKDELGTFLAASKIVMEGWDDYPWVKTPILAEFEIGTNWGNMVKLSDEDIVAIGEGADVEALISGKTD